MQLTGEEQRMLKLIPSRGMITTTELLEKFWADTDRSPPYHRRQAFHVILSSLIRKLNDGEGKHRVIKGARSGPHPIILRKERRA